MIDYRLATPADGPELDAVARALWLVTFGESASPENVAAYLDHAYGPNGRLLADLGAPGIAFRIARAEERIIGYAKLTPPWLPDAPADALQLSQIYVEGAWHGQGVARALMDWAIEQARAQGASALLLTVWEHNPRAIRFYHKLGFEHVGDYAFPVGDQLDRDLILRLAL